MFQLTKLIRPTKAIKQMCNRPVLNGASKKANEPICINYQPGKQEWMWCTRLLCLRCTRPLFLQCALRFQRLLLLSKWISSLQDLLPLFGAWDHSSCNAHWAYKTYFLYCKSTASLQGLSRLPKSCGLPNRLIAHNHQIAQSLFARIERTQGYSTTKKSKPRFFGFFSQFLTKVW